MLEFGEQPKKPRGLFLREGTWVINKQVAGVRVYKTLDTSDLSVAIERFNEEIRTRLSIAADDSWRRKVLAMQLDHRSWIHKTHARMQAKGNASGKGCNITLNQFVALLMNCNGRCEVTGIPFSYEVPDGSKLAPFQPSVDRIDSSKGYNDGNCRVVCLMVNLGMRDWGADPLIRVAKAMLWQHLRNEVEIVAHDSRKRKTP
jgi:hypothetical protein